MNIRERKDELYSLVAQLDNYQQKNKTLSKERQLDMKRQRKEYMDELDGLEERDEDEHFEL